MKKEQLAFLIARSIGRDGIKPTNVIKKSIENLMKAKKELLAKAYSQDLIQSIIIDEINAMKRVQEK